MILRVWWLWLAFAISAHAAQQPFSAKVVSVLDGDTVTVEHAKKRITVRLAGIDAPERTQAWGDVARNALTGLVLRKVVRIVPQAMDDYGRMVAVVEVDGVNVNQEQVRNGHAWENSFHHSDQRMVALQTEARAAKRGLWSEGQPSPPWEYRKAQHPSVILPKTARMDTPVCGKKQYCSQMTSCDEARFYLVQCKVKTLDKDGDGTPCESLCARKAP